MELKLQNTSKWFFCLRPKQVFVLNSRLRLSMDLLPFIVQNDLEDAVLHIDQ